MSTLNVSNITDGTTTVGTSYVVNGVAKAWINFNGATNTIKKSFNIASLTDNGTGQHDGNFTSNMDSINFSAPACCTPGGGAGDKHYALPDNASNIFVITYNSSGSYVDNQNVSIAIHGDLA